MTSPRNRKPQGVFGKLSASLFLLIFGAAGLFFLIMLSKGIYENARPYFWKSAPCVIQTCELVSEDDYAIAITYGYQFEGRHYLGNRLTPTRQSYSQIDKVNDLKARYPVGSETRCRVNPKSPSESVIQPGNLSIAFFLIIPFVFIVIGFGGIYFTWKPKQDAEISQETVSTTAESKSEKIGAGIGALFAIVGLLIVVLVVIPKALEILDSKNWVETPCQVISSQVRTHHNDDSTTYSVDIHYRYGWEGKQYDSNRYSYISGSSSGYQSKKKIIKQYPAGSETVCFVNPSRPQKSVLKRELGWAAFLGLLPLIFIGVGLSVVYHCGFRLPKKRAQEKIEQEAHGPTVLKPDSSPVGRTMGMCFVALFWNGITSVFVFQVIESFQRGRPEWFLTIFMVPFVIIGIAMIGGALYFAAALWNPRVKLGLNESPGFLDEPFQLAWQLRGSVQRLQSLEFMLIGEEVCRYQEGGGKNRRTRSEKSVFFKQSLKEVHSIAELSSGTVSGVYPYPVPPSLNGRSNQIHWMIQVRGKIPLWPNLEENFKIKLLPRKLTREE